MKKIVFYIKGIYNGGTEIALLNLISLLDKSQYDICIINDDIENSNSIVSEKMSKFAKIVEMSQMTADVLIYCTSPKHGVENIIKNVQYEKAYFWFHYFSENQLNFLQKVNEKNLVDNVVVVCETIKKKILQLDIYKHHEDNIISIYNVMPIEEIYQKSKEDIELELSDCINFVTVSRLYREKGFGRMKQLVECLIKRNIDFKWHIVGCALNESDEKEINSIINCYPGKVIMHGYQNNPYKYIAKSDYLVLLSDEENMPLTVVEAKILGVPCILSNFDSAYEQISDMKNGIILDRYDLETYADRVDDIINNKEKFKEATKQYAYSNELSIEKWNKLFE